MASDARGSMVAAKKHMRNNPNNPRSRNSIHDSTKKPRPNGRGLRILFSSYFKITLSTKVPLALLTLTTYTPLPAPERSRTASELVSTVETT